MPQTQSTWIHLTFLEYEWSKVERISFLKLCLSRAMPFHTNKKIYISQTSIFPIQRSSWCWQSGSSSHSSLWLTSRSPRCCERAREDRKKPEREREKPKSERVEREMADEIRRRQRRWRVRDEEQKSMRWRDWCVQPSRKNCQSL